MTRIIAGDLGGRRLQAPPGERTRPTSDRVREALFGALEASRDLTDLSVLDLYAGSGALGFEACSRGAGYALLVESHQKTARLLRQNITTLGLRGTAEVMAAALPSALDRSAPRKFDVVFADPPYALDNAELHKVLTLLVTGGWLGPDADVILERSSRTAEPDWPQGLTGVRSRRYGESTLWYGRALWT